MSEKAKPDFGDWHRLAGGLAHEIKNPLSTMALNLAMLREDCVKAESPKEKRTLKKIELLEKEVKRLENILNDFLRYVRAENLKMEQEDVHDVIQEVVDFVEPEARKKKVQIRTFFGKDVPKVMLDAQAFRQALLNILVNARDAMPEGGELILRTRFQGGKVEVEITDTGEGMDPGVLERCFEIYFSTKRGGTGLGLPTTKKLVEAHGGNIAVRSEKGKGTQFLMRFPPAGDRS